MISDDEVSTRARALARPVEPFAGQVYFSPECHQGYEALGFAGSPGRFGDVAAPTGPRTSAARLGHGPGAGRGRGRRLRGLTPR